MRWAGGLAAEFDTPDALLRAVAGLSALGYREMESYTPYPLPELEQSLRARPGRLPRWVFAGGVAGGLVGYGIQWYADVWTYPLRVGGRPVHAAPAFVPATFEAAVLGAALAAFVGLLLILRLPELWHPVDEVSGIGRATVDRFWLAVAAGDPLFERERTGEALAGYHPVRIEIIPVRDR